MKKKMQDVPPKNDHLGPRTLMMVKFFIFLEIYATFPMGGHKLEGCSTTIDDVMPV